MFSNFRKFVRDYYKELMNSCSAIITIVLGFQSAIETTWLKMVILTFGLICFGCVIREGYIRYNKNRVYHNNEDINKFLYEWIDVEGKVSIYSRNLTWVKGEIEELLKRKGSEVTVYVASENELTTRLKEYGTNVKYYGGNGFEPLSRFTVIRANSSNKQLAIASAENSFSGMDHNIYITDAQNTYDKFIIDLASDLVKITDLITEKKNGRRNKK